MTDGNSEAVTPNVTTVTFTENMLRSITSLTADQQLLLVKSLASLGKTQAEIAEIM